MAEPLEVILTDASEDDVKSTWDFWREDGSQVDTLREMSDILAMSDLDVAALIMTYAKPDAVPLQLFKEAADVLGR